MCCGLNRAAAHASQVAAVTTIATLQAFAKPTCVMALTGDDLQEPTRPGVR